MKTKTVKWGNGHILRCDICFQMERRGYISEGKYWDDFFDHKEKPVKYKIIKGWGKDKGKEVKYASE